VSDRLHVGIGNPWRRDDGIGPWLAAALAAEGRRAVPHPGDGAALMELFATASDIVLIDATRSGLSPGTLTRFDATVERLPAETFHYSTHRFGLAEAVETARALGQLPRRLIVYGIEGADFSAGEGLSAAAIETAGALLRRLSMEAEA